MINDYFVDVMAATVADYFGMEIHCFVQYLNYYLDFENDIVAAMFGIEYLLDDFC